MAPPAIGRGFSSEGNRSRRRRNRGAAAAALMAYPRAASRHRVAWRRAGMAGVTNRSPDSGGFLAWFPRRGRAQRVGVSLYPVRWWGLAAWVQRNFAFVFGEKLSAARRTLVLDASFGFGFDSGVWAAALTCMDHQATSVAGFVWTWEMLSGERPPRAQSWRTPPYCIRTEDGKNRRIN